LSTGEMIGFSINQTSGSLTPISIPSGLTNSNGAHSMAIDPSGQFLYAAITDRVFGFHIDATTGGLTPLTGSPFTFPDFPFLGDISIHPSGKFLYLSNQTTAGFEILGMSIDAATGALTLLPDSPYAANAQVDFSEMVFVKNGATALAGSNNKTLTIFSVNTSTGTLTSSGTVAAPSFVFDSMVLDQTGQFLYTASSGGLLGFHVQGDGTAEVLPGFPHAAGLGTGAHSVAIAPLP
jgi:6-phosphogluconolactonase (cycloisomerase 2 family)